MDGKYRSGRVGLYDCCRERSGSRLELSRRHGYQSITKASLCNVEPSLFTRWASTLAGRPTSTDESLFESVLFFWWFEFFIFFFVRKRIE